MPERAGLLGFDILRRYAESHRRRVTLFGAFRGKAIKSEYRFANGGGSFSGPIYGLDQPTDKLTLDLFRNALLELYINMPLEESAAIFAMMQDENGMVGIVDLMAAVRAEPSDAIQRFSRQRYGQQFAPSKAPLRTERVAPTASSAYTRERGWVPRPEHRPAPPAPSSNAPEHRAAPPPPGAPAAAAAVAAAAAAAAPQPPLPHPDATRDKRGQFYNGANVLTSSKGIMGADESVKAAQRQGDPSKPEAPKHRRAPPAPPPNIMYPRIVPSAFVHDTGPEAMRPVDVTDEIDAQVVAEINASRWQSTYNATHSQQQKARRAPPKLQKDGDPQDALGSGDPRSLKRPSQSGFTHAASIFIGGQRPPPPPPKGPKPMQTHWNISKQSTWVSGYNRSERMSVGRPDMKQAWAEGEDPYSRSGIPHEPPPHPRPQPDAIIMPTRSSGFTTEDTLASRMSDPSLIS